MKKIASLILLILVMGCDDQRPDYYHFLLNEFNTSSDNFNWYLNKNIDSAHYWFNREDIIKQLLYDPPSKNIYQYNIEHKQ